MIVGLDASYMGAIKQAPILVRALDAEIPGLFYTSMGRLVPRLEEEMSRTGFSDRFDEHFRADVRINLCCSQIDDRFERYSAGRFAMTFAETWIDPLKFEARPLLDSAGQDALRKRYGLQGKVVLGGCLHRDEHRLFRDVCKRLKGHASGVLVPDWAYRMAEKPRNTVVVSEVGILADLYSICDVAVIGDTFVDNGRGQNPLEPAFYGKRILSGRHWRNNKEAYGGLRASGLLQVVDDHELADAIMNEQDDLDACRERAGTFIRSQQGAATRFAKRLKAHLDCYD